MLSILLLSEAGRQAQAPSFPPPLSGHVSLPSPFALELAFSSLSSTPLLSVICSLSFPSSCRSHPLGSPPSLLASSQVGSLSLFSTFHFWMAKHSCLWSPHQVWSPNGCRVRLEFWNFCSELCLYSEHLGGERGQQCVSHRMGPFFPCQQGAGGSHTVGLMVHPLGLTVLSCQAIL